MIEELMTKDKQTRLMERLGALGRVAVAFSGGSDSALLLRQAKLSGADTLALTAKTAFMTRSELERAAEVSKLLGVRHEFIEIDVFSHDEVIENPENRCYLCKRAIMGALLDRAQRDGYTLVDGTNASDTNSERPGLRALKELGVLSPLEEAGLSKDEVRALSEGLPTKDLPSNACLATRIPCGTRITRAALGMVERAEDALAGIGLGNLRVRAHGQLARIEYSGKLADIAIRAQECVSLCEAAGFKHVCLDLKGYRTGGANA